MSNEKTVIAALIMMKRLNVPKPIKNMIINHTGLVIPEGTYYFVTKNHINLEHRKNHGGLFSHDGRSNNWGFNITEKDMINATLTDDCVAVMPQAFKTKEEAEKFSREHQPKESFHERIMSAYEGPKTSPLIIKLNLKKCVLEEKIPLNKLTEGNLSISFPQLIDVLRLSKLPTIEVDVETLKSKKSFCSIF